MPKRNHPLFFIDRSKHEAYPFDYVICTDREIGFVARVVYLPKNELYNDFIEMAGNIQLADKFYVTRRFSKGGVFLICEDFFYYFEISQANITRLKSLLNKALKKYLNAEKERTPHDGLGIDEQIKQQQLTVERAKQNYNDLLARCNDDAEQANYIITLSEATLKTLIKYRDTLRYITIYNN